MDDTETSTTGALQRFSQSDEVIVTMPDNKDGRKLQTVTGEVVDVQKDVLGKITGDPRDSFFYTVELENGDTFKGRDSDLDASPDVEED